MLFFFLVVFGFVFCPAEYFLQLSINKSTTCNRNKLIKYEDVMCSPREGDQSDSTEECARVRCDRASSQRQKGRVYDLQPHRSCH